VTDVALGNDLEQGSRNLKGAPWPCIGDYSEGSGRARRLTNNWTSLFGARTQ
jgi:hypothetical protein